MPEIRASVVASPPEGFHWQVHVDGRLVREGTAPTEAEAYEAADKARKDIQAPPPRG